MKKVLVEIQIAGRRFDSEFEPAPNLTHSFVWDGLDRYGRQLQGPQLARVHIGYRYEGVYRDGAAGFGQPGDASRVIAHAKT